MLLNKVVNRMTPSQQPIKKQLHPIHQQVVLEVVVVQMKQFKKR